MAEQYKTTYTPRALGGDLVTVAERLANYALELRSLANAGVLLDPDVALVSPSVSLVADRKAALAADNRFGFTPPGGFPPEQPLAEEEWAKEHGWAAPAQ